MEIIRSSDEIPLADEPQPVPAPVPSLPPDLNAKTKPISDPLASDLPQKPAPRPRHRWVWHLVQWPAIICGLLIIALFSATLLHYRIKYIQEVDSQGYFLMAKSFARFEMPKWNDDFAQFRGHVWIQTPDGKVMAKYSPGWPLLLAAGYLIDGHDGALWVNTILGIVGAFAIFFLALELLDAVGAVAITAIWLFSPMVLSYSSYPLGHGAEMAFIPLALWFAVRWGKSGSAFFALLAGFCTGFLPLIRATTVLIWPAIFLATFIFMVKRQARFTDPENRLTLTGLWNQVVEQCRHVTGLGWILRPWRYSPAGWTWAIGILIPVSFLLGFNRASFGSIFYTGYHFSGEQEAFDFSLTQKRIIPLIDSRSFLLEDFPLFLCLLGLWVGRGKTGVRWVSMLWFVPTFWLYSAYYFFPPGPVYWRFVLPVLPALIFGAGFLPESVAWGMGRLGEWLRGRSAELVWVVALLGSIGLYFTLHGMELTAWWPINWQLLVAAMPLLILAASFPRGSRHDLFPLGRFVMLVALVMWLCDDPSRFFLRQTQYIQGRFPKLSYEERRDAPFLLLGMPANHPNKEFARFVKDSEGRATPIALYARSFPLWDSTTYLNVDGYDIDAWRDTHFFGPVTKRCTTSDMLGVMSDPTRHARLHTLYHDLGKDGLQKSFLTHVHAQLDAGKRVLLILNPDDPELQQLRGDGTVQVNKIHEGGTPRFIWEVTKNATATTQP